MFARAMRARASQSRLGRARLLGAAAVLAAAAALGVAGCGGERQDADEPKGDYRLEVTEASFPAKQAIADSAKLRISVRNADDRTAPNVAVTVETKGRDPGGAAVAFGQAQSDSRLADPNRPVWVLDVEPKGATSAFANTWSLGPLLPGQTRTFRWSLTPVQAGRYTIAYRVSPGLDGRARLARGAKARGAFRVTISDEPVPARVDDEGNVVRGEQAGGGND
jgi:hypothetical protein